MPEDIRDEREGGDPRRNLPDRTDASPLHHGPPEDRVKQNATTADGRQPTTCTQPNRPIARPQGADHPSDTGDEKHKRAERRYWAVTSLASVAAAIGTGVAAWYAVNAYNAALQTVRETRAQVQAARDANEISSRALAAAVGSSVHFGKAEFKLFTGPQEISKINLLVPIGNDGGTTTRGLTYAGTCADFTDSPPDPFNLARLGAARSFHLTLAPKETVQLVVCSYTVVQWGFIMGGKESIYAYGHASYRDTINPVQRHYLQFCTHLYDIAFTTSAFNPGSVAMSEECARHNCNDDECKVQ